MPLDELARDAITALLHAGLVSDETTMWTKDDEGTLDVCSVREALDTSDDLSFVEFEATEVSA